MNIHTDQIERIKELGYTETEARFLYIVAMHSGYFTLGQFLTFTQASAENGPILLLRNSSSKVMPPSAIIWAKGRSIISFPGPFTARSKKTTSATAENTRLISSARASSF